MISEIQAYMETLMKKEEYKIVGYTIAPDEIVLLVSEFVSAQSEIPYYSYNREIKIRQVNKQP